MFYRFFYVGVLLVCISITLSSSEKVVCYFSSDSYNKERFTPENMDPTLCTHINYGFAILNEATSQIDFGNKSLDLDENLYSRVVAMKGKNPDLKVFLSIGGWNDSTRKYSELMADPNRRAHFVSTVIPFLKTYGFDGLDVALEYPNCWQGACGVSPEDVPNFVTFLSELNTALKSQSLLLTASVSAVREEIDEAYDVPSISKLVDHVNVMSYDWHGGWEKTTGHHSQFSSHPADVQPSMNLVSSINHWIYRGMDKSKIIVGISSYGRSYTLADPKRNGLYAPAVGPGKPGPETNERGMLAFHEICKELDSWTHFDNNDVGSFAARGDQWVGFDSPKTAVAKARLVKRRGLGGVAYKSFYTDDHKGACFEYPFPILRSIQYGLTVEQEKDFEKTEKDIRLFVQKLQLSILVDDEYDEVAKAERHTGATDKDVFIKLYETEDTESGGTETKVVEVNAGTLEAVGDLNGRTLRLMDQALD